MRLVLQLFVICLLAAIVGLGLTALALQHPPMIDVIEDGAWVAIANEGAPEVDAYALAALAHRGEPPLAIADGLTFRAKEDEAGNTLNSACSYVISGTIPSVRVWSLAAFDTQGRPFTNPASRSGYSSTEVLRDGGGSVRISVSAVARPGDWIPVAPGISFVLVLRLYDTTAAAISGGRNAPELPSITPTGCGS